MKAVILYDLAAQVETSPEDAEVMALVKRGRPSPLDDKVVVQQGDSLYLVKRSSDRRQKLVEALTVLLVALAGAAILALLFGGLVVLLLPFKFPSLLVTATWSVFVLGLLLASHHKK